jgi:hypothetical protein
MKKEKPSKPSVSKTVTLRMPQEIFDNIQQIAEEETRSFNQQVIHYLKTALKQK